MFFNLDQTDGERFQFFTSTVDIATGIIKYDDPVGDAWVTLRPMQPFFEDRLSKRKKVTEHVFNPSTRAMDRVVSDKELTYEEAKLEREDAWDYAIVGFENFKDSKTGEIIPCTRENKIKLMRIPVFDRFVTKCFQELANSGIKEKEAEEKNL